MKVKVWRLVWKLIKVVLFKTQNTSKVLSKCISMAQCSICSTKTQPINPHLKPNEKQKRTFKKADNKVEAALKRTETVSMTCEWFEPWRVWCLLRTSRNLSRHQTQNLGLIPRQWRIFYMHEFEFKGVYFSTAVHFSADSIITNTARSGWIETLLKHLTCNIQENTDTTVVVLFSNKAETERKCSTSQTNNSGFPTCSGAEKTAIQLTTLPPTPHIPRPSEECRPKSSKGVCQPANHTLWSNL